MRSTALVATLLLSATLSFGLFPVVEARTVYCTNLRSPSCPGDVCVDYGLDGRIQPHECAELICGVGDCCDPCAPPPAPACKRTTVGIEPAAVIVGHGATTGCAELTLRTCTLTYYPGEPNTPVWVCTEHPIVA